MFQILIQVFNALIRTGLVQSEYQAFNNHSKMLDNVIEKLIIVNNTKYTEDVIKNHDLFRGTFFTIFMDIYTDFVVIALLFRDMHSTSVSASASTLTLTLTLKMLDNVIEKLIIVNNTKRHKMP